MLVFTIFSAMLWVIVGKLLDVSHGSWYKSPPVVVVAGLRRN